MERDDWTQEEGEGGGPEEEEVQCTLEGAIRFEAFEAWVISLRPCGLLKTDYKTQYPCDTTQSPSDDRYCEEPPSYLRVNPQNTLFFAKYAFPEASNIPSLVPPNLLQCLNSTLMCRSGQ